MLELVFGIIWIVFAGIISSTFLFIENVPFFVIIMMIIFAIIGLYLIVVGAKKIIKNSKTNKYGLECFGIVRGIKPTGAYVNKQPLYKAKVEIVKPNTLQLELCSEDIGTNFNKYPVNSFIKCKYYKGDINIICMVEQDDIPGDPKKLLIPYNSFNSSSSGYCDLTFSEDRQTVTIDGETYIKK